MITDGKDTRSSACKVLTFLITVLEIKRIFRSDGVVSGDDLRSRESFRDPLQARYDYAKRPPAGQGRLEIQPEDGLNHFLTHFFFHFSHSPFSLPALFPPPAN